MIEIRVRFEEGENDIELTVSTLEEEATPVERALGSMFEKKMARFYRPPGGGAEDCGS